MAAYTFSDGYVSFGGTEISDHVKSFTINTGVETLDSTAMGDSTRTSAAGLSTWSAEITVHGDFAASELDALVDGLTNSEAAVEFRAVNTTVSATNPKWTGTGLVTSYMPMGGAVGDRGEQTVSLAAASALTRAES